MTRRDFINVGSAAGSALVLNNFQTKAAPLNVQTASGFQLLIFATNWGFQGNWEEFCTKIKRDGYDGAEIIKTCWPQFRQDQFM